MHTRVQPDPEHQDGAADRPGRPGADGRRSTAEALAGLAADGWSVRHDLPRPGRRFATLDHVAVGPGGVVVIDTKTWAGLVDVVGGVLRLNGVRRDRECELALAAAAEVTAWLEPAHRTAVVPVLALPGHRTPEQQPASIAAYGVEDLPSALRALPVRLAGHEAAAVADRLRRTLSGETCQLTTAALAFALDEAAAGDGLGTPGPARLGLHRLTRIRRTRR